jgi:hypothetical protein
VADREVHSRVFEHPLRIVGLEDHGLGGEELLVEAHGFIQIVDADVNMQAFHGNLRFR